MQEATSSVQSQESPSGAPSSGPSGLHLVIVAPALNEDATVADTIRRIPRAIDGIGAIDVVVVDDGSSDNTVTEARTAGAIVISHPRREGLGAAFQTGLAHALELGADLVVSIDADGQFDPETIPELIEPVVKNQADFSTASRFADPQMIPDMPRAKIWGNRFMSWLISKMIKQRFHDVSCGMRCYNKRASLSLNTIGRFNFSQEAFLNLAYKRLRMVEIPIKVEGQRRYGKSRVASNLFSYAFNALWIIFRCYRDYRPMRFFGYLAMAMMVPGAALEMFLFIHYLQAGSFSPHKWAGFTGAGLFTLGMVFLLMGVIGDMLNRHRMYLEEVLYHLRKTNQKNRNP